VFLRNPAHKRRIGRAVGIIFVWWGLRFCCAHGAAAAGWGVEGAASGFTSRLCFRFCFRFCFRSALPMASRSVSDDRNDGIDLDGLALFH
jgi:hypothetical protein